MTVENSIHMKTALFLSLFVSGALTAQTVSLDNYFAIEGIAIVPGTTEINKTAITTDGDLISAGYTIASNSSGVYHLTLTKHDENGELVQSFGTNGVAEHHINYSSQPFCIALQEDGKILVGGFIYLGPTPSGPGETRAFVSRCKSNGELDSTFATNGTLTLSISDGQFNDILLQSDHSILLSGNVFNGAFLYKIDENGAPIPGFGINGMKVLSTPEFFYINWSTIQLNDGNILTVGLDASDFDNTKLSCQKLDLEGNLVTDFADNGRFIQDSYSGLPEATEFFSIAKQREDGMIVLSGSSNQKLIMLIDEDGTINTEFGTNGILFHNYPNGDLLLQEDNKILLGGSVEISDYNYGISIVRLTPEGEIDPTFNYSGSYELDISEESDYLQSFQFMDSTHLLISGSSRLNSGIAEFMLARLDISETLSSEEISQVDFSIYPNPTQNELFIDGITNQKVSIFNTLGQLIIKLPYDHQNGVSVSHLNNGSYFLSIEGDNGIIVSKPFVKF